MCFRPPGLSKPIECPKCGKKISAVSGKVPKKCPYCKFSPDDPDAAAIIAAAEAKAKGE